MPTHPKPKKVGRPKLPKGQAKATPLQIRLNPDDRKVVEKAAKAKNQTVSDWIRNAMMAALEA